MYIRLAHTVIHAVYMYPIRYGIHEAKHEANMKPTDVVILLNNYTRANMPLFRHQNSTCVSGKTGRWTNVANIAANGRVWFVQRFWFYMVSRAQFNPNRESKVTFRICIFTCSKTNAKADCEHETNVLKLWRKISTISN